MDPLRYAVAPSHAVFCASSWVPSLSSLIKTWSSLIEPANCLLLSTSLMQNSRNKKEEKSKEQARLSTHSTPIANNIGNICHSCFSEKYRMGAPQWKNAFSTFLHRIIDLAWLLTFLIVQWMLGMLVVLGYWSFLVMRHQKHIIDQIGCTKMQFKRAHICNFFGGERRLIGEYRCRFFSISRVSWLLKELFATEKLTNILM